MPAKTPSNKATSPSKLIQRGIDQSWGTQQSVGTTAQAALAKKFTNNPVKVSGAKKSS